MERSIWSVLIVAALAVAAGPVAAHDFWVQPRIYHVAPGGPVPLTLQVGHGPDRQRWLTDVARVLRFRAKGPSGWTDLKPALKPGGELDATVSFRVPGAYVLALESTHAESDLPAIRFNDYAKVEGLAPAIAYRERTRSADTNGRETYSRRGKALVQVGPASAADDPRVTTPLGLTLEVVPERNPYTLREGEPLPVRVLYEGRPLAGALVKLTNLAFDARPLETRLTDAAGRASFEVPRTGAWLVNVIWTKRITGNPKADFDTVFSSLTFAFPAGARR